MTGSTMGLNARYIDVTGTAKPHSLEDRGFDNEVAGLLVTSQFDGGGVLIEGRPEEILEKAREMVRAAELIVEQTMRDPALRSLYGLTSVEASQGGTVVDSEQCEEAGQHVRATRHTRWDCPFVTEVDRDWPVT